MALLYVLLREIQTPNSPTKFAGYRLYPRIDSQFGLKMARGASNAPYER